MSTVSGHHVTLPPGAQDDSQLPEHGPRATHYERGDLFFFQRYIIVILCSHDTSNNDLFAVISLWFSEESLMCWSFIPP